MEDVGGALSSVGDSTGSIEANTGVEVETVGRLSMGGDVVGEFCTGVPSDEVKELQPAKELKITRKTPKKRSGRIRLQNLTVNAPIYRVIVHNSVKL